MQSQHFITMLHRTQSIRYGLLLPMSHDLCLCASVDHNHVKGKDSPYSIAERRVPELIPVLGSQPAGDMNHKPGVGCHYFQPGQQLPSQPMGQYQFRCLVNRGMKGMKGVPKTVTRQCRGCNLNPGATAPESSMLTTRLLSHPHNHEQC